MTGSFVASQPITLSASTPVATVYVQTYLLTAMGPSSTLINICNRTIIIKLQQSSGRAITMVSMVVETIFFEMALYAKMQLLGLRVSGCLDSKSCPHAYS